MKKKITVLEVVNIKGALNGVNLHGAPLEDVKKLVKFHGEAYPIVTLWDTMYKEALSNLGEGTISVEELDRGLNKVLGDEANREVEITPFVISEDTESIILSQSKVVYGQWEVYKNILKPEEESPTEESKE